MWSSVGLNSKSHTLILARTTAGFRPSSTTTPNCSRVWTENEQSTWTSTGVWNNWKLHFQSIFWSLSLPATIFQGFPTRMVYLYYISCLRYTGLVGDPRFVLVAFLQSSLWNHASVHHYFCKKSGFNLTNSYTTMISGTREKSVNENKAMIRSLSTCVDWSQSLHKQNHDHGPLHSAVEYLKDLFSFCFEQHSQGAVTCLSEIDGCCVLPCYSTPVTKIRGQMKESHLHNTCF